MTKTQATAEVFVTALRALPKRERRCVLARIADEKDLREDLFDLALFAKRRHEPSRPFRDYLEGKSK